MDTEPESRWEKMWDGFVTCMMVSMADYDFANEGVGDDVIKFAKGRMDLPVLIVKAFCMNLDYAMYAVVCERKEECEEAFKEMQEMCEPKDRIKIVEETTVGEFLAKLENEDYFYCDYGEEEECSHDEDYYDEEEDEEWEEDWEE